MWRLGMAAAAAVLAAPVWAQTGIDSVVERLAAQGYGGFEIERADGTVKVEAVRNGVERELVYDASDGSLIEDSQRPAGSGGRDDRGGRTEAGDDHGGRIDRADRAEAGDDNGGRTDRDDRTEAGDDHGGRTDRDDRTEAGDDHGSRDDRSEAGDDRGGRGGSHGGGDDRGGRGGRDDDGGDDHGADDD